MISPYIFPGLKHPKPIEFDSIVNAVCEYFDLQIAQLVAQNRRREIITARHTCIYIIKQKLPNKTFKSIGEYFGGQDHTTVMNAILKINNFMHIGDAETLNNIAAINSLLNKN